MLNRRSFDHALVAAVILPDCFRSGADTFGRHHPAPA